MEKRMRRMTKAGTAIAMTVALMLLASGAAFAGEKACQKYHEHMAKYHKHIREAQEEARDGDWDDYHEEMEKARRDLAKAESYEYLCEAVGGCEYRPKTRRGDYYEIPSFSIGPEPGRRHGVHDSHGSGCSCGRSTRDFGHGRRRLQHRPRRRHVSPRGVTLRYRNGHFEIVYNSRDRGHGRRRGRRR